MHPTHDTRTHTYPRCCHQHPLPHKFLQTSQHTTVLSISVPHNTTHTVCHHTHTRTSHRHHMNTRRHKHSRCHMSARKHRSMREPNTGHKHQGHGDQSSHNPDAQATYPSPHRYFSTPRTQHTAATRTLHATYPALTCVPVYPTHAYTHTHMHRHMLSLCARLPALTQSPVSPLCPVSSLVSWVPARCQLACPQWHCPPGEG